MTGVTPSSSMSGSRVAGLRAWAYTVAPAATLASTRALPMPRLAPVIGYDDP